MKKLGSWIVVFSGIVVTIILSIISSVNLLDFNGGRGLNTQNIEKNIGKLKGYSWFNELYENEEHHRSFFVSLKIRKYLESSLRVSKLIRSEKERVKFIVMLEEVALLRNKG